MVLVITRRAEKRQPDQAEHVKGGEYGGGQYHRVENLAAMFVLKCAKEDGVFRKKSGEGEEAGDGNGAEEHAPRSDFNLGPESAHVPHVLLAAHSVNNAAGGKEEQCFEEGMGHQVKHASAESANTAAEEHVAELADGGIGQNFLNVGLHQTDG